MTWSIHLIICFFYREHRKIDGNEDKEDSEHREMEGHEDKEDREHREMEDDEDKDNPETDDIL